MKNKGFTLVEVLAVFVIMGILTLITIPAVQSMISNSKKEAMIEIANRYLTAFEQQLNNKEYLVETIYDKENEYIYEGEKIYGKKTPSEKMLCDIPPIGYYTIAPISIITVESGKSISPWGFNFNNNSSVIIINKKTSDTEIGDEAIGELTYYIYISDEENNGILKYHSKPELSSDIVSISGELAKNKEDNSTNSPNQSDTVSNKLTIDNIRYGFYQKCKEK
ncbi:MAG: type II secretion system protein [Bacilli bacterium]|nr:type II secretion system protein [Bacilli bacterium]